jgi:DNA-binding transcriptional regulator YhcF (GntR family)
MSTEAPYRRIFDKIAHRIRTGQLRPGDRVPSARQITREFGVAIATATKVLTTLRQEGLVRPVAGVGTVVAEPRPVGLPNSPHRTETPASPTVEPRDTDLTRDRIITSAISVADADGLAGLSMRRIAAELGVAAMSLYRYVPRKDDLLLMMVDTVFGWYPPPDPPPAGLPDQLEASARLQWQMLRDHPWCATVVSLTRPMLVPNGMAHTEWVMRAGTEAGLDPDTAIHLGVTVAAFVMGIASHRLTEREAQAETGLTSDEWMNAQEQQFYAITSGGRFPLLASLAAQPDFDLDLDRLFELGLGLILDSIPTFVARATARTA